MHEKLKKYFEEKGISQKQIAEKLGVSVPYVNAVLNGTKTLGKKNAEKWANLFGLSKSFLLSGEGDPCQEDIKVVNEIIASPAVKHSSMDRSFLIEKEIGNTKSYMEKYIASLEDQVKMLKNDVAQRDKTIDLQDRRIQELEVKIKFYQKEDPLKDYPFEMGVADRNNNKEQAHV